MPAAYRSLFTGHEAVIASHRGWDPGALVLAQNFAEAFQAPAFTARVTRLLVELNRSLHHRNLFSEFTRPLGPMVREQILQQYWWPYRSRVESAIRKAVDKNRFVIHVSAHTFTPILNGDVRSTEVGLLFDPSRSSESRICRNWQQQLKMIAGELAVHRNAPYRGTADGFVTWLRKQFSDDQYAGIELEVNQKFVTSNRTRWKNLRADLLTSFASATRTGIEKASSS